MSTVGRGLGAAHTPNIALDDILRRIDTRNTGGRFRSILGGVVGGATNLVAPGLGTTIGGLISGGRLNSTGLLGESEQFLELQRQMQMEMRAFETASTVLKTRHDASMSAIRNIK
jgi:hypothetical protein